MANPLKGEVQLDGDGPVLVCDFNALCEIEAHFADSARSLTEGLAAIDGPEATLSDLRAVVAALLRHHLPRVSLRDAGDIIDLHGDQIPGAIRAAFTLAMPEADPAKKPKGRRPRPAI